MKVRGVSGYDGEGVSGYDGEGVSGYEGERSVGDGVEVGEIF